MDAESVAARLHLDADPSTAAQLAFLTQLAGVYEREGVIDGGLARPLWQVCERAGDCWRRVDPSRRVGSHGPGPMSREGRRLPAVGRTWVPRGWRRDARDQPAMDGRNDGGLAVEHRIAQGQIKGLRANNSRIHSSDFARMTTRALAMVLDAVAGQEPSLAATGSELAAALQCSARIQSIKCSPLNDRRDASKPSPEMWRNCPGKFLAKEIEILRPGTLLVFGKEPLTAVRATFSSESLDRPVRPRLHRGIVHARHGRVDVWALPHPRIWGGAFSKQALPSLREELQERSPDRRRPSGGD